MGFVDEDQIKEVRREVIKPAVLLTGDLLYIGHH